MRFSRRMLRRLVSHEENIFVASSPGKRQKRSRLSSLTSFYIYCEDRPLREYI